MPKGVYVRTEEMRRNIGKASLGRRYTWSLEARTSFSKRLRERDLGLAVLQKMRRTAGRNWKGGAEGDYYAALLCPLGYVREYHLIYDFPKRYIMDFALPAEKVNIELDGVWHWGFNDTARDAHLRSLGWKVIRVKA